jgi:hypothetical protein
MVADGMTDVEILAAYPDLAHEDIREALRYAAEAVRERELPLALESPPPLGAGDRPKGGGGGEPAVKRPI